MKYSAYPHARHSQGALKTIFAILLGICIQQNIIHLYEENDQSNYLQYAGHIPLACYIQYKDCIVAEEQAGLQML